MSAFLNTQGCTKVGYEESMATSNGHQILLAAHIDDFIIVCAHRPTLDNSFRSVLLAPFDGTNLLLLGLSPSRDSPSPAHPPF